MTDQSATLKGRQGGRHVTFDLWMQSLYEAHPNLRVGRITHLTYCYLKAVWSDRARHHHKLDEAMDYHRQQRALSYGFSRPREKALDQFIYEPE